MSNLPVPDNEKERLAKLHSYNILDTSPEAQFDDLTRLAANICDVPICLISLVDENRQWFKSSFGLDATESSRDISFCQHAIMQKEVFEIEDLLKDERFSDNPFVKGDPNIRFYSGAQLVDDEGISLGTLCVIDKIPKKLSEDQRDALKRIANTVMRLIRLKKINEERSQYAKFFKMSLDMLCIAGTDGYFKILNPAFTNILGWTEEELKSKPFLEFVHPEDTMKTIAEVEKLSKGADTIGFENRYRTKDESYKWMHWTCHPIASTGELFAVAHDVTELKKANELAQKSIMAKDLFLANMSHEIRTPLNAIIGFTDLLEKTSMSDEQAKYVNTIGIASDNLLMLINNVLDISKIESGNLELEKKVMSIKDIINDVLRLNSQKAKEKNLKLISSVDHEIPDYVLGDPARLVQILLNLLGNAVKFTHEGTIELKITSENISKDDVDIRFSIKDTGIGIPKDKIDKMFDRFTQAETSTTRKYGGTGLGLNIVRRLVDLQGGAITVKSIVNEGTEFEFKIRYPLARPETQEKFTNGKEKHSNASLEGMTILLVEDNEHNQILATTYLEKNKAKVELAENGALAIEMVLKKDYDCILMDLQMPVMNGYDATLKIRDELRLNIPIIACTAHSLVGEKNKSIEVGMDDYITKPFSEFELIQTILKHVKGVELVGTSTTIIDNPATDNVIEILQSLENELGSEFVNAMMNVFNNRTPDDIKELKQFLDSNDVESLRKKAHLIAGSCGSLRFIHGHKLAKDLEKKASENSIEGLESSTQKLIDYLENTLEICKKEFQS